jgi:protein-S-isoprenylcysteine O-methyltransferase Ste14
MDVSALTPGRRVLFNGAFFAMLVGLPALTWYMTICMLHYDGHLVVPSAEVVAHVEGPSLFSVGAYLAWLAVQGFFQLVLPGRIAYGVELEDGRRLPYKMNGLMAELLTIAVAVGLVLAGAVPGDFLYAQLGELVTTANIVVFLLCVYFHVLGRTQATPQERARNPLEAYFVGATRNPRNGSFDWKFFSESRPGMILWILINLSFLAAQYELHGTVSNSLVMVAAFQTLYVTDYFVFEEAILSTWDIRHEPFGWMLGWGSLVWVPFTYSLQGMYLVQHPVDLPVWAVGGITALNLLGYAIFRGSNLQKHRFRSNPQTHIWGKPAQYIQTERGTKLLTSGWWGISRHSNYLGDLMMGLAWCLCTGWSTVLCYFYIIYFTILLVHRERRDNEHCAHKYGADWNEYARQVPWRILPGVY